MKRIEILLLLSSAFCFAEEVTLTKPVVLKADRSIVSLKAGTTVELLGRTEKTLTIRFGKTTGTIPVGSIAAVTPAPAAAAVVAAPPAVPPSSTKKEEPAPTPEPTRKAVTNYGKAVEKAKANAAKHDKNLVKPTDEILP